MLLRRCWFHTLRRTPLRALSEGSLNSSLRFIDGSGIIPVSSVLSRNTLSLISSRKSPLEIFCLEVYRAHTRRACWLPLCVLFFDEIHPIFTSLLRNWPMVISKWDLVKKNSIFWIWSVRTARYNAPGRHNLYAFHVALGQAFPL